MNIFKTIFMLFYTGNIGSFVLDKLGRIFIGSPESMDLSPDYYKTTDLRAVPTAQQYRTEPFAIKNQLFTEHFRIRQRFLVGLYSSVLLTALAVSVFVLGGAK